MVIRKKPDKNEAEQIINSDQALAFIQKAAVNQVVLAKDQGKEKKKPIMLKLWQSELEAIDKAVALYASKQPLARNKLKRHAFIIKAIFEKIERITD